MTNQSKPLATDTVTLNKMIFTHQDLFKVVDRFYAQLQNDKDLSATFNSVHDGSEHVDRLTHFWWVRFGGRPYLFSEYTPVSENFLAGFNQDVLTKWLQYFHQALKENLTDPQAHVWSNIAIKMGQMLMAKNEFFRATEEETET